MTYWKVGLYPPANIDISVIILSRFIQSWSINCYSRQIRGEGRTDNESKDLSLLILSIFYPGISPNRQHVSTWLNTLFYKSIRLDDDTLRSCVPIKKLLGKTYKMLRKFVFRFVFFIKLINLVKFKRLLCIKLISIIIIHFSCNLYVSLFIINNCKKY